MINYISIVTLLFVNGGNTQDLTPTLTQFMSHEALEGTTTELECNVTNKGDRDLFWYFDPETGGDGYLIGDGVLAADYSRPRFSIVSDTENGHYNLKIMKLKLSDAGLYTCTLTDSGLPSSAGRLRVLQPTPPSLGPVCELNTLALREGEYINGSCRASPSGITPSSLQWYDGRDIPVTSRQEHEKQLLRIAEARDDGARYVCRERHRALEKPRDCITGVLEVLHKPVVAFHPEDWKAKLGSNATLTCRTTANPSVQEARLYINDSRLGVNESLSSVDSRFSLITKDTDAGKDLVLTIHWIEEADYLLPILCQAWNEEGETNQTTSLEQPIIGGTNLMFILAVDIAALTGVVVLVAVVLSCKPACAKLCRVCKRNNRQD